MRALVLDYAVVGAGIERRLLLVAERRVEADAGLLPDLGDAVGLRERAGGPDREIMDDESLDHAPRPATKIALEQAGHPFELVENDPRLAVGDVRQKGEVR